MLINHNTQHDYFNVKESITRITKKLTKTYRIIKTGTDDPSISLNSSYGSFRSSLDLNADLCCKNISPLEKRAHETWTNWREDLGEGGWDSKVTSWSVPKRQHCYMVPPTGIAESKGSRTKNQRIYTNISFAFIITFSCVLSMEKCTWC